MKQIIILILCMISFSASAQDQKNKGFFRTLDYSASYCGNNLWNPGLKFGAEYVWKEKINTKTKRKKTKIKTHQFLLSGDVGFYWDPQSHVGTYNYYGLTYRKTNTRGFQYTVGIKPLSYYRSFLPETYEVSEQGNVNKVFLPGRGYYAPTLTLGIGKLRKNKKLKAWFINVNIMTLYPYNADFLPIFNIAYGYRFNFKKK